MSWNESSKCKVQFGPLQDDIYCVAITGDLAIEGVGNLETILSDLLIAKKIKRIIVDLSETRHITSSGIGVLVSSTKAARDRGGDLLIAGAARKVRQVLDMVGFGDAMKMTASLKDALKHFGTGKR